MGLTFDRLGRGEGQEREGGRRERRGRDRREIWKRRGGGGGRDGEGASGIVPSPFLTCTRESQLPTYHLSIWFIPQEPTDSPPLVILEDLHASLSRGASSNQPQGTLRVCCNNNPR